MFILPVGHDEDELRRWPWVSISIAGLCVLAFLGLLVSERRAERAAMAAARQVFEYAVDKRGLVVDEDLLFGETAALWEEVRGGGWWDHPPDAEPDQATLRQQQAELDRLTARWRRAVEAVPLRAFGLVPAELEAHRLVTHVFVHAGWLHLVANLFFFWLLAPPLEDVWGRPLFALVFLAAGVTAGILWVAHYPNSNETVVGASGAVAGLMGAFMVRFWRTKIRFVGFVLIGLRIRAGSFRAPAWLMLGVWFLRELALSSLFEPHVMAAGGVASRAHLYGFGFGVLAAAAIRGLGVEERWVRPKLIALAGDIEQPALEAALESERQGQPEEAWRRVAAEVAAHPHNLDAVLYWWELATRTGREGEVAPHMLAVVRAEIRSGQPDLAWRHFQELRQGAPELPTPPALRLSLAEALLHEPDGGPAIAELVAGVRAELGTAAPAAMMARLARVAARAGLPGAAALCARIATDPDLPQSVRSELRRLATDDIPDSPAAGPAIDKGGIR